MKRKSDPIQGILFTTPTTIPVHLHAKAMQRAQKRAASGQKPTAFFHAIPSLTPSSARLSRRTKGLLPKIQPGRTAILVKKITKR